MSMLDALARQSQSPDSGAVPEPWHRTVYEDQSEDKNNAFLRIAGKMADIALGIQIQAVNATVQVAAGSANLGAQAARSVVRTIPASIPAVSLAANLAERVGARARRLSQEAREIAKTKNSPAGSETGMVRKLAADMFLGPAIGIATLPVTVAVDVAGATAETATGRAATDAAASVVNAALDQLSVSSSPTVLDTSRIRETWLAMTTGPGRTALVNIFNLAAAMGRLSVGDTRSLADALDLADVSFNYGMQYGRYDLLYPRVPVGMALADASSAIVRYMPATYISALRTGDLWKTANATIEDSENVVLSAISYPIGFALVVVNVARFLAMGLRDCNDIDEFIRREMQVIKKYPELGTEEGLLGLIALNPEEAAKSEAIQAMIELEKKRPFTCTEFEYYVGNAKSSDNPAAVARGLLNHSMLPPGVFPQDVINLAQDTAFYYSAQILGREDGLIRMLRLYGAQVRDRLAADPTLGTDAALDASQIQVLLDKYSDSPDQLQRMKYTAEEEVRSFDRLEANPDVRVPSNVRKRRQFFLNLIQRIDQRRTRGAGPIPVLFGRGPSAIAS